MSRTFLFALFAIWADMLTHEVVFPTPPLFEKTAIVFAIFDELSETNFLMAFSRTLLVFICFFSVSNYKKWYYEQKIKNFVVVGIIVVGNNFCDCTALGRNY